MTSASSSGRQAGRGVDPASLPPLLRNHLVALNRDLARAARWDYSVSMPDLGGVFDRNPENRIAAAFEFVAEVYGARHAYLGTAGTTPLNSLVVMSLTTDADTVVVDRGSHASVLSAVADARAVPAYAVPTFDHDLGVPLPLTAAQVAAALQRHPRTRTVVVTSPNYFGLVPDLAEIAAACGRAGARLVVDGAHSAYYAFHDAFPIRGEEAGATATTISLHKTIGTLGQVSLALIQDDQVAETFYRVVNTTNYVSTSFSTLLLASGVSGVLQMAMSGHRLCAGALEAAAELRKRLHDLHGIWVLGEEHLPRGVELDPLRITVDVAGLGHTGYDVADYLYRNFRIVAEMETITKVVLLLTPFESLDRVEQVVEAFAAIPYRPRLCADVPRQLAPPPAGQRVLTPAAARSLGTHRADARRRVPVREAVGAISGETITTYPPGSAVIVAGERITADAVDYLREMRRQRATLKGAGDQEFETIEVVTP